jgi:hypothetical protein
MAGAEPETKHSGGPKGMPKLEGGDTAELKVER